VPIENGERLRAIRQQRQLSLREVEERSLRFAQEPGSRSHRVSASWLDRLERGKHELTVSKLIALASVYNILAEQLLHEICPVNLQPTVRHLFSPNATMLLTEGPMEEQAKYLVSETLGLEQL
jgi:transcriptional regulator with XRE-family HTH domain